jgi:uncharacterized protein (TIGR03066 family)
MLSNSRVVTMKTLFATLSLFVLAGFAAAEEKFDAKKIVGKWTVSKTEEKGFEGTVIEFGKDGKLTATLEFNGKSLELEGTYSLKGDKLTHKLALKGDTEGKEKEETETVTKLTDDELVTVDAKKKETTFKKKK